MNCTKCGNPIEEKDKVCPNCGQPVEMPEPEPGPVSAKPKKKLLLSFILCGVSVAAFAAVFVILPWKKSTSRENAGTVSEQNEAENAGENIFNTPLELPETRPEGEKTSLKEKGLLWTAAETKSSAETKSPKETKSSAEIKSSEETVSLVQEKRYSNMGDVPRRERAYYLEEKKEPETAFSTVLPDSLYEKPFVPISTAEIPESGLGNVAQTEMYFFSDEQKELLEKNGFFVQDSWSDEYYEIYEDNRYDQEANFVTVDSLMHTYHLYFQYLLKSLEYRSLTEKLTSLTESMLRKSMEQYNSLSSDEKWSEAALNNVEFFSVAARLLSDQAVIPKETEDIVNAELELINAASAPYKSPVMGYKEDYSQYKPRGYYAGNETLERYFRTMMWYGRCNFLQDSEQLNRSALLMVLAMNETECYSDWETIYAVTSFFAGKSDDLTCYDYLSAIREAYGETIETEDLIKQEGYFVQFCALISGKGSPKINSLPGVIPGSAPEETLTSAKGFRFMGQRFSIDAAIFQQLIYDQLAKNAEEEERRLPNALDIPASLGSDAALGILKEKGIERFPDYVPKVETLRTEYSGDNTEVWQASLYSQWLYALRPLLVEKKKGYPWFMTGTGWTRKDLETFLGSYAELKHDTILYSKQAYAAEGDGEWEEPEVIDDRGYVEPEYQVYACITALIENTKAGLQSYGILSKEDADSLGKLSILSSALLSISQKELKNKVLTEDEYELIRSYGTYLEKFWLYTKHKDPTVGESFGSQNNSAAIIADVATDAQSMDILEVATGEPSVVYAIAPVAGELKIVSGAMFSFYQFVSKERLTDSEWRQMMGWEWNENGLADRSNKQDHPSWTECYRFRYK